MDVKSIEIPTIGKVVIPYRTVNSEQKNQSFGYIKPNVSAADPIIIGILDSAISSGVSDSGISTLENYVSQLQKCNLAFWTWIEYIHSLSRNTYLTQNISVTYTEPLVEYVGNINKEVEENAEK